MNAKDKGAQQTHQRSRNVLPEISLSQNKTIIDDFISRSINPQERSFTFNSIIFANKENKKTNLGDVSPSRSHSIEPKTIVNTDFNSNDRVKVNRILRENQIPINKTINLNLNLNLKLDIKMMPANKVKFNLKSDRGINTSTSSSFISNNSSTLRVNNLKKSFYNCSLIESKSFINKIANTKNAFKTIKVNNQPLGVEKQSKFQNLSVKNLAIAKNKNKENAKVLDLKDFKNPQIKEKLIVVAKKSTTNGIANASLNRLKNPIQTKTIPLGKIFK